MALDLERLYWDCCVLVDSIGSRRAFLPSCVGFILTGRDLHSRSTFIFFSFVFYSGFACLGGCVMSSTLHKVSI